MDGLARILFYSERLETTHTGSQNEPTQQDQLF